MLQRVNSNQRSHLIWQVECRCDSLKRPLRCIYIGIPLPQGKRIINSGITGVEVENFQKISLIQSRQEPFGFDATFERLLLL